MRRSIWEHMGKAQARNQTQRSPSFSLPQIQNSKINKQFNSDLLTQHTSPGFSCRCYERNRLENAMLMRIFGRDFFLFFFTLIVCSAFDRSISLPFIDCSLIVNTTDNHTWLVNYSIDRCFLLLLFDSQLQFDSRIFFIIHIKDTLESQKKKKKELHRSIDVTDR